MKMGRTASLFAVLAVVIPTAVAAQYRDAEALDARGPVHRIVVDITQSPFWDRYHYRFAEDGQLAETPEGPVLRIEHDAQGRLVRYVYNEAGSCYGFEYDGQGRVCRRNSPGGETLYTRDADGRIVSCRKRFMSDDDLYEYTYLEFDDHGNWTRRSVRCNGADHGTEARRIFYREDNLPGEDSDRLIVLTGQVKREDAPESLVDEYYRDLLQYDIHGWEHTYRVVLGQTTMAELLALKDVDFDEAYPYEEGLTNIRLSGAGVRFDTGDDGNLITGIEYDSDRIPPIWKVRYGIDSLLLTRSERRMELATVGIDWLYSSEAVFLISASEVYAVRDGDREQLEITILPEGETFSQISVNLQQDDRGHYYRLAPTSHDGQSGGFLRKSFGRLGAENREREVTVEETLQATSLTAWTLVNRPLGVLPGRAPILVARSALARCSDWHPEWTGTECVRLTPEEGYNLAFENVVPEVTARFADEGQKRVKSFAFDFHLTRGDNFLDDVTDTALRLNAQWMAMKIVNELTAFGFSFEESPGKRPGDRHWHHADSRRSVDIDLRQESRLQTNDSYSLCVRVQWPDPVNN